MKNQTVGVEVEMNSITREQAARTVAKFFGTTAWNAASEYGYCFWACKDTDGRVWKFQKDVSIAGPESEKCEMVTPILTYLAVGDTQEIIQECAEKECRVKSGDRFAFCNFQVNENYHSIPYFTSTIKRTVCEIFSQYVREVSSASANFHDGRKAACATVGAQAALFYRKLFICRFCCHFSTCGCAVLFLLLRS